ncbi:nitroreductase A [Paenibacillus selenitireducens]|uniref:Nitroreductase A n=1 Tax=Paenibacillus selenitireducens TaxID=1324314 RepID=A0A1T2X2B0_9BACL|nr:oxygen-insensitive NADPH nitroreductase [Paenibacillus selenitireducens]OPA73713.1 nitroreductase A [Paenibacillus selenitireducens]
MNSTIDTILGHYSIRDFEDRPLTTEQIRVLVQSAQAASTSSYVQAYSIIGVSDPDLRAQLAELTGRQSHVSKTGQFFVFVADLAKHHEIAKSHHVDDDALHSTEKMLVAVIDASLAAQNMAIAAESMGLGICYIGGIRNHLQQVSELLKIPDYAVPLFGLTVGIPTHASKPKQRLPIELVYHENMYDLKTIDDYKSYDADIKAYYEQRTQGARVEGWTDQMAKYIQKPTRLDLKAFLESKHFGLK